MRVNIKLLDASGLCFSELKTEFPVQKWGAAAVVYPLRALIERKIASKGDGVWPLIKDVYKGSVC